MTTEPEKDTDDVSGAARPADAVAPGEDDVEDLEDLAAEPAPNPDREAAPPIEVAELAAACVRFVAARYKGALDFAPDTLSYVDQWLRDGRVEVPERPEVADVVQAAAGAYFGEVVRRAFGGRWVVRGHHSEWKLCLSSVYCAFNPLGMAREALLLEPAEGWGAHLELDHGEGEAIGRRLDALPHAEDDEYYAPTTRFDVLTIVFDALREGMRERGLGDVRFEPDDYA
ncbi:MAG: hypothetical protein ACLP1X_23170 [Polyangiaceae bacterium]